MTAYSHDMLIDQDTGEFDWAFIKRHARTRAARAFGGPNPPPKYIREELRVLTGWADAMRYGWRKDRGLPQVNASPMVIPAWGDSGDSFNPERK